MIPLSLREIAQVTGGHVHPDTAEVRELRVTGPVVTDSREVGPGGLYLSLIHI